MPSRGICPSVCLSVTFVYFVETNTHNLPIFSQSGSHTILVFPHQTLWQYSDGDPLTVASDAGVLGKNRDSQRIPRYPIDDWWIANNNCDRPK